MLRKILSFQNKNIFNALKVTSSVSKNFATEATFETKDYKLHLFDDAGPPTKVTVTRDDALRFYKQMLTIRRFETAAGAMYKEKLIRGFCHLYNGQEAICVGMYGAMRPNLDDLITSYRCHGFAHVMGASVSGILCELVGHIDGTQRGKGGSMHIYVPHFYGGNGIVGAQVPLGAGMAFAHKYRGTNGVAIALYGDGASNQGQIFEAFNMSKLWDIPMIYVCENNGWGMSTSSERSTANTGYYTRGDNIPGIWCDGMDVLAVREATRYAIEHAASGKGPVVMELATYRFVGHSMTDPGLYRTRDEVQEMRQKRDPITHFKEKIIESELASEEEIKKLEADVKKEVEDGVKKAKGDLGVNMDELTWDIYAQDDYLVDIRNTVPFNTLKHKRVAHPQNL
ncbi:unnamed protein product [Chironomus riparius]|uniref:Pyruvate dehydrogenase E1 component subunit alpha n=1 Tax=Chironomus riparius TaxID=315576 RepID=A0A9N9WND3_9DIPT|nr:unnamed protein product [Chironomus riparius]